MAVSSLIKNTALDGTAFVVVQHLLAEPVDDHRPVDPEQKVAHSPRHPAEHLLNLLPADIGFDLEPVGAEAIAHVVTHSSRVLQGRAGTSAEEVESAEFVRTDAGTALYFAGYRSKPNDAVCALYCLCSAGFRPRSRWRCRPMEATECSPRPRVRRSHRPRNSRCR